MPLTDYIAAPSELITSEGWNAIINEILTKVSKTGDIINGDLKVGGELTVDDEASFNNLLKAGADLEVEGVASFKNQLLVGGNLEVKGAVSFDSNLQVGGNLGVNGTTSFGGKIQVDDKLGIGTSDPQSQLHFTGDLTTKWGLTCYHFGAGWGNHKKRPWLHKGWNNTIGDYLTLSGTGNRNNNKQSSIMLTENGGILFGLGHNDANQLSQEWIRINTQGRLGIGTDNPRYRLDVTGSMRTTSRMYFGAHDSDNKAPDTSIFEGQYLGGLVAVTPGEPNYTARLNIAMRHNPGSDPYLFQIGHTWSGGTGGTGGIGGIGGIGGSVMLNKAFDAKLKVDHKGKVRAEGNFAGGGADYADLFESHNGRVIAAGTSVVITEAGKVRRAKKGETPIGVITNTPALLGNDPMEWQNKYVLDEFGNRVMEKYNEEVPISDEAAEKLSELPKNKLRSRAARKGLTKMITGRRPKINPEFDPKKSYVPRSERPEWQAVGLLGQLRLRKGHQVAPSWVKIMDVSDKVELWLVK